MKLDIQIKGAQQLLARLNSLATTEATKAGQSAIRSGGTTLLKAVKAEAPVGPTPEGAKVMRRGDPTSHHKIINSLKVSKIRSDNEHAVSVSVHVGGAYQAMFVEFGSIHNHADPFMLRALNQNEQLIIDAIGTALGKQLTKRGA